MPNHAPFTTALLLLALAAAPSAAAGPAPELLARWQGGGLTLDRFHQLHENAEELLREGGSELRVRVLKTVYQEIYHARALETGLDRDPRLLAEIAKWEQRQLANLYRERHGPKPAEEITAEIVREHYAREIDDFRVGALADFDLLFVHCELADEGRSVCRGRMEELQGRAAAGEELDGILAEERDRSGEANGSFRRVDIGRLFPELRAEILRTAPGSFTSVVENYDGLFWARVVYRTKAGPMPLEKVERRIRRTLAAELDEGWRRRAVKRLLAPGETLEAIGAEALFARAARAESLHRSPEHLARRQTIVRWKLADAAFYRDKEMLPSDEELAAVLESEADSRNHLRVRLLRAVVDASGGWSAALRSIHEIHLGLTGGEAPGPLLREAAEAAPWVRLDEIGPMSMRELRRRHGDLMEVVEGLEAGQWKGPYAHRSGGATGRAFLLLESMETPSLDETRDALYRAFRARIGGGGEFFLSNFGRRWGLEVLVGTAEGG